MKTRREHLCMEKKHTKDTAARASRNGSRHTTVALRARAALGKTRRHACTELADGTLLSPRVSNRVNEKSSGSQIWC